MNQNNGLQLFRAASFMGLLLILVVYPLAWPLRLVVCLLLLVIAVFEIKAVRAGEQREWWALLENERRESENRMIRTLNHHRHDWMNDIQVLFGYIKLKKYEPLQDYVEKIKFNIGQESGISKLGVSRLVAYLLSFRTLTNEVRLEVEMGQEIRLSELPLDKQEAAEAIIELLEAFRLHAKPSSEDAGLISLELAVEEDHLLIDCVYQGGYNEPELKRVLHDTVLNDSGKLQIITAEFSEEEAAVSVGVPFIHN
ncbi:Spo0B domain-containing protein [Paenibacillus thalictri]|nr:Spo0B domain-containing protein [Paenibacillus thalictri]